VAQALPAGQELGLLGLARRELLDLGQLEVEQVELPVARTGQLPQPVERPGDLPRAGPGGRERRTGREVLGAAGAVEQLELGRGEHEPRCSCWP
jgi:hypothetical protein